MRVNPVAPASSSPVKIRRVATYPGIRVLTWHGAFLYASRKYQVVRMKARVDDLQRIDENTQWEPVARFNTVWWRCQTSRTKIGFRLVRDGFHALAIYCDGDEDGDCTMIGAIPGAIITRAPACEDFKMTHEIRRGTRPLHLTAVPGGRIYWGEYFDNRERAAVHIYASADQGQTWQVAYTFPARSIRHVHNIVYDRWANCLWILTGDEGAECKVLRADCNLSSVEEVLGGNQQARAVAAIPTPDALYLATDTPFEENHILRLDRRGDVAAIANLPSSSTFGCRVSEAIFFSTMVEPSAVNTSRDVHLIGSIDGSEWQALACWRKDKLPMRYFQYGNIILPDGDNTTNYLAATTIAVERDDLTTSLWEVESSARTPQQGRPSL